MATDDGSALTAEMIKAVRDLSDRLTAFERKADTARKDLRHTVDQNLAALRKDVHEVTTKLQLDASQHRDEHIAERKERAADHVQRTQRQALQDRWMGALTTLVVLLLILSSIVAARVLWMWFGV